MSSSPPIEKENPFRREFLGKFLHSKIVEEAKMETGKIRNQVIIWENPKNVFPKKKIVVLPRFDKYSQVNFISSKYLCQF